MLYHKIHLIEVESKTFWVPKPTLWSVIFYLKTIAFGYSDTKPWFYIAFFYFMISVFAGTCILLARYPIRTLLIVFWAVIPVIFTYVLSFLFKNSIFLIRSLLPYAPAFYLLAAGGFAALPGKWLRLFAGTVCCGLAAIPLWQQYHNIYPAKQFPHRPGIHLRQPFREASMYIDQHWRQGDIVVHSSSASWMTFHWYSRHKMPQYTVGTNQAFIDFMYYSNIPTPTLPETRQEFSPWIMRQIQPIVSGYKRVWLVFSEWHREYLWNNPVSVWLWLSAHYHEIDHQDFGGLEIYLFESLPKDDNIARVEDDGVRAILLRGSHSSRQYVRIRPDVGIYPSGPDRRKGPLSIRFENIDAVKSLSRPVEIILSNHGEKLLTCHITILASDKLVNVAGFREFPPSSDMCQITSLGKTGHPAPVCDLPALWFIATQQGTVRLDGCITSLHQGMFQVYAFGEGIKNLSEGARITLKIGEHYIWNGFTLPLDDAESKTKTWTWRKLGCLYIDQKKIPCQVIVTRNHPDEKPSQAGLGYIALVPAKISSPLSSRKISLEPHTTLTVTTAFPADAHRLDIWAVTEQELERVYWIFCKHQPHAQSMREGNQG